MREIEIVDENGRKTSVWDVIVRGAIPVMFALLGWFAKEVLDHRERLAVIESNRYTKDDATADRDKTQNALEDIRLALPHRMFYDKVNEIADEVKKIEPMRSDLKQIEARLAAIEKR